MGLALMACHHALGWAARVAACTTDPAAKVPDPGFLWAAYAAVPDGCRARPLLGDLVALMPTARPGMFLGLANDSWPATTGQLYALGLLVFLLGLTIFFIRWDRLAQADGYLLALVWTGVFMDIPARFLGVGSSIVPLTILGHGVGLSDLTIAFGLIWAIWRIVAELRN